VVVAWGARGGKGGEKFCGGGGKKELDDIEATKADVEVEEKMEVRLPEEIVVETDIQYSLFRPRKYIS